MLTIFDGQDGTGKSTLLRLCRERDFSSRVAGSLLPDWELLKANRPTSDNLLTEYLQPLLGYSATGLTDVACDRWFLGELVYPQLTGRTSLADPVQLRYLVNWLRARGALLVHVTARPEVVLERLRARDASDPDAEPHLVDAQAKLFAAAVAQVRELGLSTLTIDTSDAPLRSSHHPVVVGDLLQLAGTVNRYAAQLQHAAAETVGAQFDTATGWHERELGRYVGPLRPRLLLVGDEQGPAYPELTAPFVPLRRGCGAYLWRALSDSEPATRGHPSSYRALEGWVPLLSLADVGVVNSRDDVQREPTDLRRLWRRLGEPPVATLGDRAAAVVRRLQLPGSCVARLPHPQWVRRFHHARLQSYGAAAWASATTHTGEDLRETWQTFTP